MGDSSRPRDKWRHGSGQPGPAGKTGRGFSKGKLFLALFVFAALVGVAIGLFFWIENPPKPVIVSIAVTEYANPNFPVNAFAEQDSEALCALFPKEDRFQRFDRQEREHLLGDMKTFAEDTKGKHKDRPLIVHLCANALVYNGTVYVIPGDGTASSIASWISLEDLLAPLAEAQGDRLLLLDLRPVVNPRIGVLADRLAEGVQETLKRLETANRLPFACIASCGPGSTPVVCRELNRSPFGWFLERGLAGVADGWNSTGTKDRRVSSQELLTLAHDSVAQFTSKLGRLQAPALYGKGNDFRIFDVPQDGPKAAAELRTADDYPPWLVAGWQERDDWREEKAHIRLPRTYRHLEAILQQAEAKWLGGANLGKAQNDFEDQLAKLRAIKKQFPRPAIPVRSLAQAKMMGQKNRMEPDAVVQKIIDHIRDYPAPTMKENDKLEDYWKELVKKPPEAVAAADRLWAAALTPPELNLVQLKLLADTWDKLPNRPLYMEMFMLRFVTEAEKRKRWSEEPGTIPRLLLVTQRAEEAAVVEGRCLPWIAAKLKSTELLRIKAVLGLLDGLEVDRKRARQEIDNCVRLYEDLVNFGTVVEAALTELDETRVFLASWAGFEAPDDKIQQKLDQKWSRIIDMTEELQRLVDPVQAEPDLAALARLTRDLPIERNNVRILVPLPGAGTLFETQHWMAWPFWSNADRRELASRLTNPAEARRALQGAEAKAGAISAPAVDAVARDRSALRLARQALDLLRLAGDADVSKPVALAAALERKPDTAGFQELGQLIARHWMDELPDRYRKEKDPLRQERMGWAIHPFDLSAIPLRGDQYPRDAAAVVRDRQARDFVEYLIEVRDQQDIRVLDRFESDGARKLKNAIKQLDDQSTWKK